jgi:hypothetical protein
MAMADDHSAGQSCVTQLRLRGGAGVLHCTCSLPYRLYTCMQFGTVVAYSISCGGVFDAGCCCCCRAAGGKQL